MYTHYAVGVPVRKFSQSEFECLLDIIAHNAEPLKKALGTDDLAVVVLLDRIWFPWFTPQGLSGEIEDYHILVSGLCALARNRPHDCVRTDNRHEVRDLIYRSGLTVKGRKLAHYPISILAFLGGLSDRWCVEKRKERYYE